VIVAVVMLSASVVLASVNRYVGSIVALVAGLGLLSYASRGEGSREQA